MIRAQAGQIEAMGRVIAVQSERVATVEAKYEEVLRRLDAIQVVLERIATRTAALEDR